MTKTIVVVLTPAEAAQLLCVAEQGWGDGDHADWLGDKRKADACERAIRKLTDALHSPRG